ncbi:hypothetical protein ABZ639_14410 [Saccharomonospora sp. NPDC006951]
MAFGAVVVLLVGISILSTNRGGTSDAPPPPTDYVHVVLYRVEGDGPATTVSFIVDGGSSFHEERNVSLPWEKTIRLPKGEPHSKVQLNAKGPGTITVAIRVDGQPFKDDSGSGAATVRGDIGTLAR